MRLEGLSSFINCFAFLRFSSFLFVVLRFPLILPGQGETPAIYWNTILTEMVAILIFRALVHL